MHRILWILAVFNHKLAKEEVIPYNYGENYK